jgi:hypothetical protein
MKLGDVYYWETKKATGHKTRHKYHLFICTANWEDDHTFLFISSDGIEGDFRITNPPYGFLTKSESFISCSSIVTYKDDELEDMGPCKGHLSKEDLEKLFRYIADSDLMPRKHIRRICNAIHDGLHKK